jgi:hypothetical protein
MLWPRRVWWVAGDVARQPMPLECAGCGDAAAASPEGARGAARVPYCSTCLDAHARYAAVAVGCAALAVLSAVTVALAFPLLWPRAALGVHLLWAVLAALLPLAALGLAARYPRRIGAARSLWPILGSGCIVERYAFAERLASAAERTPRALRLPPFAYRIAWWCVPALALVLAALAFAWHHPRLRVLNLTGERIELLVDAGLEATIDPVRQREAEAVVTLRLPRGQHSLEARDARGRNLAEARVELLGGREHLYAPGGSDECFWLEVTGYGRDETRELLTLASATRFFSLEKEVDTWLSANPPPSAADRRSTGGTLTALRHSPCGRAPEAVRHAASALGP